MKGSSSTTSSFSPLPSAPCSTSLTAPQSPLGPIRSCRPHRRMSLALGHRPGPPASLPSFLGPAAQARALRGRAWHDEPGTATARGAYGMQVLETFLDAMGNTPLVRLHTVTRGLSPTILAKLEMLNPGG